MSSMRGTQVDHESNLDALLEDLQTTVSRSNSAVGLNGQVTGYRSFRRTVTDGTPEGTSSEYQVEYLNPSNSTTQIVESSYNNSSSNIKNDKYNKYRAITSTTSSSTGDAKMKQNISELDSLLDDLNAAQKKNFSSSSMVSTSHNHSGIDSGLLEPTGSSTPAGSKLIQKLYREEKTTTSMRGRSPSPRGRELVFTGTRSRDPSPIPLDFHTSFETREETPNVQQVYRYEKTTTSRTTAPVVTTEYPSPYGTTNTITYGDDAPLAITDRSPSPINRHHNSGSTSYYNSINRDTSTHHDRVGYPRDHEPDSSPRYGSTKTAYSYSNSTTRESRSESRAPPPPPHRSPSPVSFNQPPLPGTKNSRSYADSSPPPARRSQSPHQFSPSDPTHNKLTYNVSPPHANHSYKYTSTTTTTSNAYHDQPNNLKPRPFPTSPGEQQPPKKLDELLATLSDGNISPSSPPPHDKYSETNVHRYTSHHTSTHHSSNGYAGRNVGNGHPPVSPSTPEHAKSVTIVEQTDLGERQAEKEKLIEKTESKGTSGPPVYYPPGVELFTKKEESMMQKQEGGSKYKAMAKYEYEAKSKSKHTESSGKAVVPVCLPVCCAMPCSIM